MFELGTAHLNNVERERDVEDALRRRRLLESAAMTTRATGPTGRAASPAPRTGLRINAQAER